MRRILLFDMDGVLLEPQGYHRALQETVRLVGEALGYSDVILTPEDIAAFEAAGVSSEWDSAAICAAKLLENLLRVDPTIQIPSTLNSRSQSSHRLDAPDFQAVVKLLDQDDLRDLYPLKRAGKVLPQHPEIAKILRTAREPENSLTHRTFQELILGSVEFEHTYNLPRQFESESYLSRYDRSMIPEALLADLQKWLKMEQHGAAIFTNRPSRGPSGNVSTPEAEIGAALVGLSELPIVGFGELSWLSADHQFDSDAFLKPSPVHALAALLRAIGTPAMDALQAAAQLVQEGERNPVWKALNGAQVYAFEDTRAGLNSVQSGYELLADIGIEIKLTLWGITTSKMKTVALINTGALVHDQISTALEQTLSSPEAL